MKQLEYRIFNSKLGVALQRECTLLSEVEIHRHKRQHELSGDELQKHDEEEEPLKETERGNSSGLEEVSAAAFESRYESKPTQMLLCT